MHQNKRIREKAPHRRSMSLTDEDIQRLSYLEKLFTERFPHEVPFSFSKTVSKAVELAYMVILDPRSQLYLGDGFSLVVPSEQSEILLQTKNSGQNIILPESQEMVKQDSQSNVLLNNSKTISQTHLSSGKPKKFVKKKRGF